MATFGAIASAAPNVLFDPAKVDLQVQGLRRNELLMQNAVQDQQQQTYMRDTQARLGLARELANLPEDQAAAEWGNRRSRLQSAGFGRDLPEQFPGMARIQAIAASDLTTFERLKIEEQRRATDGLQSMFGVTPSPSTGGAGFLGGGASVLPASMPGGGVASPYTGLPPASGAGAVAPTGGFQGGNGGAAVRSDNATADAQRQRIYDDPNMSLEQKDAALRDVSMGRARALGQPVDAMFRANPGVGGAYAGVPAPGGQAPSMPASSGGGGQGALPALITSGPMSGLTQDQAQRFQAMSRIPGANPTTLLAQVESVRQSNQAQIRQQAQDERQRRLDAEREAREDRRDQRAAAKDARSEPNGPFRGASLEATMLNTLLTADPSSPEYAAAYGNYGAERRNMDGSTTRPDMSMFRAPAFAPPGAGPAVSGGAGGVQAAAPGADAALPTGGAPSPTTANPLFGGPPPNALSPQAQGGRSYGRADATASNQPSSQAREAVRKAEVEVARISSAIDRFEEVFSQQGGGSIDALFNNPTSPAAQKLLGAFESMKVTLRSESFMNTGVLQPAEARMLDEMLLSPQSIRGVMATPEAMKARLAEMRELVRRGLAQQRASAGLPPEVSVPGPGGQGTASPPQPGASRRLTFNPATGRIE